MKKFVAICLICLFFMLSINVGNVFALPNETISFYHDNKIFTYSLANNIKQNLQFDINFKLNKYNRFSSKQERQALLNHLLSIGIAPNIAVNYLFPNLSSTINTIEKNVFVAAKNSKLSINHNSQHVFTISDEIIGKKLDATELYHNICTAYLNNKDLNFTLPIIETFPKICAEYYKSYTHLRADFSTNISTSSADRKHNIKNALNSINRIEIPPNAVFSFNKVVGKRTESNGYRNAKIIVNNEFVDGVGGGVCQVSSTLYNAALLAGLEIVEANKHSKQVGYVKYGFDAMVNFGSSDLKFKNNTGNIITIITNYSSSKIRIRIFGESLNGNSYKLINEILDVVEPTEEIIYDTDQKYTDKVTYTDEYCYLKPATKGMTIKSYREHYINNELVEKVLLRTDKFNVQNSIKVYGIKAREEINSSRSLDKYSQHSYTI